MGINETLSFLEKIELFRGLNDQELNELAKSVKEKNYKPDELLFRENGPREDIFIIFEGEVELFKTSSYGVEMKLAHFSKGDFLGEGSWANDSPHSTTARALVPTVVLSINKDFFDKKAETTLKIFSNIARVISRRMRSVNS